MDLVPSQTSHLDRGPHRALAVTYLMTERAVLALLYQALTIGEKVLHEFADPAVSVSDRARAYRCYLHICRRLDDAEWAHEEAWAAWVHTRKPAAGRRSEGRTDGQAGGQAGGLEGDPHASIGDGAGDEADFDDLYDRLAKISATIQAVLAAAVDERHTAPAPGRQRYAGVAAALRLH